MACMAISIQTLPVVASIVWSISTASLLEVIMVDIYTIPSPNTNPGIGLRKRRPSAENLLHLLQHVPGDPNASNRGAAWGRASSESSWLSNFASATWVVLAPLTSAAAYVALHHFDGSLAAFGASVAGEGFWPLLSALGLGLTVRGAVAWCLWVALQAVLYLWLPSTIRRGQPTPAGCVLDYRINGLAAWAASLVLLGALSFFGVVDPAFVPKNWGGLVAAMNVSGICLSVLAFVKAHVAPTHADDRKFSGCLLFDFYMGIEMNPRLGADFDLKLFNNGRIGMIAWSVIDLSNLAFQYERHQRVSPALVLVTLLHGLYIGDFFVHEGWYLRTMDMAHDHFGFYMAWGCFAWLPTMYTLQSQYLGRRDPAESPNAVYLTVVCLLGLLGYAVFRSANDQKDLARSTGGKCAIWGRPAVCLEASYTTLDGAAHRTVLLCSGWWGLSRHANYAGDLVLSAAVCALAGVPDPLVWFYAAYMGVLLVHRCLRDEARGRVKYGRTWDEYCRRVPWRLVPGVW